jgi:uncharacterized membrane protein YkvA (DUF1232 family)
MTTPETTIPVDLDRYLATNSGDGIISTAAYVERGGTLVTPRALSGLRALRRQLQKKIDGLPAHELLRARLEMLVLYVDECAAERATLSPAIRESGFALLYFLKGFDRIPDSVPEIGLLDDALIVEAVLERNAVAMRAHWLRRRRSWPLDT